jgi:anti-anti-sigma factor
MLSLDTKPGEESWRIEARGELDLHNAHTLEAALREAEASGAGEIVLDLSALEFIDSTGLRTVVQASRRAGRDRLGVVRGSGQVARLMEITVLDEIVRFVD